MLQQVWRREIGDAAVKKQKKEEIIKKQKEVSAKKKEEESIQAGKAKLDKQKQNLLEAQVRYSCFTSLRVLLKQKIDTNFLGFYTCG